ncbi:hypothetical protein ACS0TY_031378 [Phlomoides rotata]
MILIFTLIVVKLKSHLTFADDVLLFSRGDEISVGILRDALDEFEVASGLAISPTKSSIFSAGLLADRNLVLGRVGFSEGLLPVKYLGVPLAASTVKVHNYDVLINRLADNIKKWSSNFLPIPVTVIKRIESVCKTFLWGSCRGLVAWDDVCKPKESGGLGLRDLTAWNSALLARIIWDVHNKKDSLWIKWVSESYLNGSSIWDFVPRKTDSKLLRFVANVRDSFVEIKGGVDMTQTDTLVMCGKAKFNSKKMYFLINSLPDRTNTRYDMLWRSYIAPKYSFIGWLALQGKLATKDRLQFLNIDP